VARIVEARMSGKVASTLIDRRVGNRQKRIWVARFRHRCEGIEHPRAKLALETGRLERGGSAVLATKATMEWCVGLELHLSYVRLVGTVASVHERSESVRS